MLKRQSLLRIGRGFFYIFEIMTGKERRKKMDAALKEIAIPFLRQQGFKGSFPHFRREKDGQLNLLTFQFSLYSPEFVVEIATCATNGHAIWHSFLQPSECRVSHMGKRLRIGSIKNKKDYWYEFEKESIFGNIYETRAKEVIENWNEAEEWWFGPGRIQIGK